MQLAQLLELEEEGLPAGRAAEPFPELNLYWPALLPKRRYLPCFLASVFLHCILVFGLPSLIDLLPESDAETTKRLMQAMRSLEIRVPDRLYLPPLPPKERETAAARPRPTLKPTPEEVAKASLPPPPKAAPAPLRSPPKLFEPPRNVRRVDSDQTLIQPHLPPEMPLTAQVKLPQLVLLSGPALPRPTPRRFVEPGKSADPAVAPRLDAPPQLAAPNDANPDLKIESMLAGPATALLRLPRPNVPVRKFQAPSPIPSGRGASVSPTLGEPISVLAISADPAPLEERVVIPLGNQIGRLPNLPAFKETATGATGSGAGSGGTGSAAGAGSGPGSSTGSEGDLAEFARALAALPQRYATPIKIEHPANAVFDVVVMQSAADPAFSESAGVLSGQPVYTVYLQVGAPKAWVLQYCIPRESSPAPQIIGGAVNIGAPSTLKAPFPLVTLLPPVTMLPRAGYILVHGSVDTKGQFRDLTVIRAPNAKMKELIKAELARWHFRPAVRDGAPVAVEILLA
ncbi:MAG TPA: hypothetical protein VLH09_03725, partial [Bryobacteraceae bacterium]|nr:hypothetical protein [Bryobacteraceae bacterium]